MTHIAQEPKPGEVRPGVGQVRRGVGEVRPGVRPGGRQIRER